MTDTSTQPPPPPVAGPGPLDDTFTRLRASQVRRDGDRRWFGGVCAGIAARFDVDPLLIRAAAIALAIAGGVGIPVYLVLWLLLPDTRGTVLAERAVRHGDAWAIVLSLLTGLAVLGSLVSLASDDSGWHGPLWLLVPVGVVVWLVATRSRRHQVDGSGPAAPVAPPPPPAGGPAMAAPTSSFAPPAGAVATVPGRPPRYGEPGGELPPPSMAPSGYPPPPPGHPAGSGASYASGGSGGALPPTLPPRPVVPPPPPRPRRRRPSGYVSLVALGLAMGLTGLGSMLAGPLGWPGPAVQLGFAVALAGVSLLVLGLAVSGRAAGGAGFVAVVLAAATGIATAAGHAPEHAVGSPVWQPSAASVPASYGLGLGDATLDLSGLASTGPAPEDPPVVSTDLGAGSLTIEVPEGLTVRVDVSAGEGTLRHEVRGADGLRTTETRSLGGGDQSITVGDGDPDVVVDVELGFGDVIIEED